MRAEDRKSTATTLAARVTASKTLLEFTPISSLSTDSPQFGSIGVDGLEGAGSADHKARGTRAK